MAESALSPERFSGTEDAIRWWQSFDFYCAFKGFDNDRRAASLPLFLKASAIDWYQTLPEATKTNFQHLQTAFEARYHPGQDLAWARVGKIFNKIQGPNEPVQNYIEYMQSQAQGVALPDAQLRQAILNGLKPSIRQVVLQNANDTIENLKASAVLAENAATTTTDDTKLVSAINRLEQSTSLLEELFRQFGPSKINASVQRSPSPRRVTFRDEPPRRAEYRHPFNPAQNQSTRRVAFRDQPRDYNQRFRSSHPSQDHQSKGGFQKFPRGSSQIYSQGRRVITCYNCGKQGHIKAECRAVRVTPSQGQYQSHNRNGY